MMELPREDKAMGNMHAMEAASLVDEGMCSLRLAVEMNLTSNHFPPIPPEYVEPVCAAIEAANDGDPSRVIGLECVVPTGMTPRDAWEDSDGGGLVIDASSLLEITHSWAFVYPEDFPDWEE